MRVYSLSVCLVFTIFCRLSDLIWMCRIHICCSHTCVCLLCCFVWIVIFCRFIGYTSNVYRHMFLTVHIYAHPLSVLSGLWSCTGVFCFRCVWHTSWLCFSCLRTLLTGFPYCVPAVLEVFRSISIACVLFGFNIRLVFILPYLPHFFSAFLESMRSSVLPLSLPWEVGIEMYEGASVVGACSGTPLVYLKTRLGRFCLLIVFGLF